MFILVILIALIFIIAARTPLDSDLYWHLSAGRWMAENNKPLLMDPFSYTRVNQEWINHSWLSEVILFQLYRFGGWMALSIFVGIIAVVSMGLLYTQMKGPAIFRAFIIVLGCIPASLVWSPRPQVISLLFLSLLSLLLSRFNQQRKKIIWFLPLLFCFWGNLLGGYVLGIILYGIWVGGYWVDYFLEYKALPKWEHNEYYLVLFAGFLSILALMVNPNSVNILLISFKTVIVESLRNLVSEWSSPDFHVITQQSIIWVLAIVIVSFAINKERISTFDVVSIIIFFYMALVSRRNFGPFALVAVPVIGRSFWLGISGLNWNKKDKAAAIQEPSGVSKESHPWVKYLINSFIATVLIFIAVVKPYLVSHPILVDAYTHQQFPVSAYEYWQAIKGVNTGELLSEYNWGGYIIWADKQSPVFLDGRTDLYGDEVILEWVSLVQAENGYKNLLEKYNIHAVMLMPDRPLVNTLKQAGWLIEYQDPMAVLLVENTR
jgi:hypothetical protein